MTQQTLTFNLLGVRLRNGSPHPPLEVPVTIPDGFTLDYVGGNYRWDATPIPGVEGKVRHELNLPGWFKYTLTDKNTGDTMIEAAQRMIDSRFIKVELSKTPAP